jgi:acetyl esterase/lipase
LEKMSLDVDKEFLLAAAPVMKAMAEVQKPKLHDIEGRRQILSAMRKAIPQQVVDEVKLEVHHVSTSDQFQLPIYHFTLDQITEQKKSAPGILHLHGGGLIALSPADVIHTLSQQVLATGVQFFSVDYRLAPEFPYPTPLEDCWTALNWILANAERFNIDPSSIAVMGESAGGNLSAALALLARDRNLSPPLYQQILIYPMLDDRNTSKAIGQIPVWDEVDNLTGWAAYLGQKVGTTDVPAYAAPARVKDVKGIAPLYLEVGQLDLYMKEDLEYASKFLLAGIETELHVYPGVPHGFDGIAPNHTISKLALENRQRVIRKLLRK